APRPTCSRVTTADGRSPGSRVATFRRLPGTRDPSGVMTEHSPLTVAGAAAASAIARFTAFPFDPRREPSRSTLEGRGRMSILLWAQFRALGKNPHRLWSA